MASKQSNLIEEALTLFDFIMGLFFHTEEEKGLAELVVHVQK